MSKAKVLHLPDCNRVRSIFKSPCDCKNPPHPLPANKKMIRTQGRIRVMARNAVLPKDAEKIRS